MKYYRKNVQTPKKREPRHLVSKTPELEVENIKEEPESVRKELVEGPTVYGTASGSSEDNPGINLDMSDEISAILDDSWVTYVDDGENSTIFGELNVASGAFDFTDMTESLLRCEETADDSIIHVANPNAISLPSDIEAVPDEAHNSIQIPNTPGSPLTAAGSNAQFMMPVMMSLQARIDALKRAMRERKPITTFDDLNSDDDTDTEANPINRYPDWCKDKKEKLAIQEKINPDLIDNLFASSVGNVDSKEIFPNENPEKFKRHLSSVYEWFNRGFN